MPTDIPEQNGDYAIFLRTVSLFEGLDEAALAGLAKALEVRDFMDGEVMIFRGEDCDDLFLLCNGSAVAVINGTGETQSLAKFERGDFFGEMAIFDREPRSATVQAVGECTTLKLTRDDFIALTKDHPVVLWNLCVEFTKRLRATTLLAYA